MIKGTSPQLSFHVIKTTECFNTMHALTKTHSSPTTREWLVNSKKFPISIVTRCVKFYLKGEGYHHKHLSLVLLFADFHVLSLFFIGSRLYLPRLR
jgi:hypothetical protein